jgi:hypothetical protein
MKNNIIILAAVRISDFITAVDLNLLCTLFYDLAFVRTDVSESINDVRFEFHLKQGFIFNRHEQNIIRSAVLSAQ